MPGEKRGRPRKHTHALSGLRDLTAAVANFIRASLNVIARSEQIIMLRATPVNRDAHTVEPHIIIIINILNVYEDFRANAILARHANNCDHRVDRSIYL